MNHPMYYVQTEIQKIKPFLLQAYLKLCLKAKRICPYRVKELYRKKMINKGTSEILETNMN